MTTTWWLIEDSQGGLRQVATDGSTPEASGENMAGRTAYKMTRKGDLATETPNKATGTWTVNLAGLRTAAMDEIDDRREAEQMKYLTTGGAKKMIYAQKSREVCERSQMTGEALAALTPDELLQRFPAATAEANLTGETLTAVLDRFQTAEKIASDKVYKLEAIAQKAKRAIRSATTLSAIQVAAQPDWTV